MTQKIVIYTDNAPAAALFQRVLGSRFDYVHIVRDRETAFIETLGNTAPPNLLVLDATVPDAAGFYEYVRERAPYLAFLVVGGGGGNTDDPLVRFAPSSINLRLIMTLAVELVEASSTNANAS